MVLSFGLGCRFRTCESVFERIENSKARTVSERVASIAEIEGIRMDAATARRNGSSAQHGCHGRTDVAVAKRFGSRDIEGMARRVLAFEREHDRIGSVSHIAEVLHER